MFFTANLLKPIVAGSNLRKALGNKTVRCGVVVVYVGYPNFWESLVTGKLGYEYYPQVYPYQSLLGNGLG